MANAKITLTESGLSIFATVSELLEMLPALDREQILNVCTVGDNEAIPTATTLKRAEWDVEFGVDEEKGEAPKKEAKPKAARLTKQQKADILAMRSGQGSSDDEIADNFGVEVSQVRRLLSKQGS